MRVLQINSVFGQGSTGRIASDICDVLRQEGHEGIVAYGRGEAHPGHFKFATKASVLADVVATRLLDRHGRGSRRATQRLLRFIKDWNPDIIHLHNIHGYYVNYPMLFSFLAETSLPVVWTLHDCWPFTGHCAYFDFAGCEKWKDVCHCCPQKREYPASFFVDASRSNHEAKRRYFPMLSNLTLVTPSAWLACIVKQSFLGEKPVVVINNGVDLSRFCPSKRQFRFDRGLEDRFIILGVASVWTKRKGLVHLLRAIEVLPEDCVLVVVGVVKDRIPVGPRVIHIPHTNSVEEIADLYSSADVFVNPTLEDNFPTTNVEALACGTPIITFETGGSPESLDIDTGAVVPKGNQEGLLAAILKIRGMGRAHYSGACINRAAGCFAKTDRYRDYIALYRRILDS